MLRTIVVWILIAPLLLAQEPPGAGAANPRPPQAAGKDVKRAKRPVTDRPSLGVQFVPVHPGEENEGVRINYVFPGSAAAAMGLKTGDEVIEMDGAPVASRQAISQALQRVATGTELELSIRRGSETLKLRGPMGSFLANRKTFIETLDRELVGKPFSTAGEILWPDGIDGLKALKGKAGVVIAFDGCSDCVQGTYRKFSDNAQKLRELKQDWIEFCGIYSNIYASHEMNAESRMKVLAAYPARFPIGLARYPNDLSPPDSFGRDPLIQNHGIAILDPEGKILYLDLLGGFQSDNPMVEFTKALAEAARKYGPKSPEKPPTEGEGPPQGPPQPPAPPKD